MIFVFFFKKLPPKIQFNSLKVDLDINVIPRIDAAF